MNAEISKQFVSYEIAVRLKALGFNEPCFGFFTGNNEEIDLSTDSLFTNKTLSRINKLRGGLERFQIAAPLLQQAVFFINNLLYEELKTADFIYFVNKSQAEKQILKALELIEKQKQHE